MRTYIIFHAALST